MSSNTPDGPSQGPEYVGSGPATSAATGPERTGGSGKKWAILGGAAVGVVAVVGLGGWAALSLLSTGSQPSTAIPSSAVGYLSLDLDPSAAQKIEAFKTLNKFPGIEKELEIEGRDDLRRYVFDRMQEEGVCKSLDYAEDIEPWIGDRIAVAAVPGEKDSVAPLFALQVTDQDAATTGAQALARCAEAGDEVGFAVTEDYLLIAESTSKAEAFADDARASSLADDSQFTKWTDAAGNEGIVTMYAAPEAPEYLMDLQGEFLGMPGAESMAMDQATLQSGAPISGQLDEQLKKAYKDFDGMAGVIRFEGGAVEVEFAGKGVPAEMPEGAQTSGSGASSLPAGTGAALSASFSAGWVQDYLDQMSAAFDGGDSLEDSLAQMEAQTGLNLPEDIETLFGDSIAVAVDADIDFEALAESEDPSAVPAGIKVNGDPQEILPIVEKLKATFGPDADLLVVESSDDAVALGLDESYVQSLLEEGRLGDEKAFSDVVPEADDATGVFYVNFDAGNGWADELADFVSDGNPMAVDNVKPLDALGISTWADGDEQHGLLRLTTD